MKGLSTKKSLPTAIFIGVGSVIGSGWLFAAYYAAQDAGPIAILSWIIGALFALSLALLLSEIVTMYQERGLFARLLTISHNRDYGFIVAISNWLGVVLVIPSEAVASVQYLGTSTPFLESYIFHNHELTGLGIIASCFFILVYTLVNYWGIKSLAKVNNLVTIVKLVIPLLTGFIALLAAFHSQNFTLYKGTIAPYGISHAFSAVITSGIFYAFFGFNMIAIFTQDLKNPKKNVPIALTATILICLSIYLVLQFAFIGALPPAMVEKGWHQLNFSSPLAQLMLLLGINFWAIVLYADSVLSPSGTGIIYAGSGSRMLTGMSRDSQMPRYFDKVHPTFNISRRSLFFTVIIGMILIASFKNWQKLMILVTVFQLISCVAVPVSFTKLRTTAADKVRQFRMPFGKVVSYVAFIMVTFLLTQAGIEALLLSLVLHVIFFLMYGIAFYKSDVSAVIKSFRSAAAMFCYLAFVTLCGYLSDQNLFFNAVTLAIFFALSTILFSFMLRQKNYQSQ